MRLARNRPQLSPSSRSGLSHPQDRVADRLGARAVSPVQSTTGLRFNPVLPRYSPLIFAALSQLPTSGVEHSERCTCQATETCRSDSSDATWVALSIGYVSDKPNSSESWLTSRPPY